MAKTKDTFIFYDEWCELLDTLGEHEVFLFMRAISAYRRGEEYQIEDPAVAMAFKMAKIRMDKNEQSYKDKCDARAEAGAKGGTAKAANANDVANLANVANASFASDVANVADMKCNEVICSDVKCSDVTCNDLNGSEKDSEKQNIKTIVEYLNDVIGAHYKPDTPKTVSLIKARLREGFTVDDFKTVIDKKAAHWARDGNMQKYLRPETLFGTKFEGYLNEHEKPTMREEVDSWV